MAAASRIVLTFGSARIEHNYYVGLGRPIGFCIWCNKFFKTNAALKLRATGHTNEQSDPGGCKMEHALSRCLPVIIINIIIITSKEIPQEHRHPTFDLIAKLRARRLKWTFLSRQTRVGRWSGSSVTLRNNKIPELLPKHHTFGRSSYHAVSNPL